MELFKNKKFLTYLLGLFIILIMVGSALNLRDANSENEYEYNNYRYILTNNGWLTYLNNQQIILNYGPRDLENIDLDIIRYMDSTAWYKNMNQLNYASKIYISFNPNENLQRAILDLIRNINFNKPLINSCPFDNEACSNLPLKTCDDATDDVAVMLFREANNTKVSFENNCLNIEGSSDFVLKVADRLVLKTLGLI